MAKLIVSEFMSLDGVIQAPGGKDEDRDGGFEHGGCVRTWFTRRRSRRASSWHCSVASAIRDHSLDRPRASLKRERPVLTLAQQPSAKPGLEGRTSRFSQ
jgi:hypothetical protein